MVDTAFEPKAEAISWAPHLVPPSHRSTPLLDQSKTLLFEMADILQFSTNITEETLLASTRLSAYPLCSQTLC
jgi:hypothetical protein